MRFPQSKVSTELIHRCSFCRDLSKVQSSPATDWGLRDAVKALTHRNPPYDERQHSDPRIVAGERGALHAAREFC